MATEMVAGRELDMEIATRVFGKTAHFLWVPGHAEKPDWYEIEEEPRNPSALVGVRDDNSPVWFANARTLAPYSTDIWAAWMIVEHLMGRGCYCTLTTGTRTNGGRFFFVRIGTPGDAYVWHGDAETAPLAICRCALVAVAEMAAATGEGE